MSFQTYLDNIQAKTGKSPADWRAYAQAQGYMRDGALVVAAGALVADLKRDFALGHGHAMAVYALLKGLRKEGD